MLSAIEARFTRRSTLAAALILVLWLVGSRVGASEAHFPATAESAFFSADAAGAAQYGSPTPQARACGCRICKSSACDEDSGGCGGEPSAAGGHCSDCPHGCCGGTAPAVLDASFCPGLPPITAPVMVASRRAPLADRDDVFHPPRR